MTEEQKKQAKRSCKLKQLRRELAPVAVDVCDKVLGPIPRDQQTLDALEVARLLIEAAEGSSDLSERQRRILRYIDDEFRERFMDVLEWNTENIPEGMDEANQDAYEWLAQKVHLAFEVAHREAERRDNWGQAVEDKLEELTETLIAEMT